MNRSLENETDEALMVMYQQGDYMAFSELYARHSGKVYAYLRGHLFQTQSADDLLQTAFLKLHEHRDRYDGKFPFLPWLFSITRNAMIDQGRKKVATPVDAPALEQLAGSQTTNENEVGEIEVETALASLPQAQRDLIQMRFKEGLSFEDIGARLAVSEPTVRKRISWDSRELRLHDTAY